MVHRSVGWLASAATSSRISAGRRGSAVGDLGQRLVEHADVVGGGVRPGVTRPKRGGEEIAGVVAECQQRVIAEGLLERRGHSLFLRVADQHVRV